MAQIVQTDWYRHPYYYDLVFDGDTPREADFLEAAYYRYGRTGRRGALRILEPACGTGRLMIELARRRHRVSGFDLCPEMVAYARERAAREMPEVRRRLRVAPGRMQAFRHRGPYDMVHCLLSTFKYLLTEADALACLRRIAHCLAPGGLFILGIHLTDYARRTQLKEVWHGADREVKVLCETVTKPPDRTTRLEWLRNRLRVTRVDTRETQVLETNWQCRTYDASELRALLSGAPELEVVGCHDFGHEIDYTRALDDSQEDLVVVLRRRREL